MSLSSDDWDAITSEYDDIRIEILDQAMRELHAGIRLLECIDCDMFELITRNLGDRSRRIEEIKAERTPVRPELGSRVDLDLNFKDG